MTKMRCTQIAHLRSNWMVYGEELELTNTNS